MPDLNQHKLFLELLKFLQQSPDQALDVLERALDGIWFWDIRDGNDEWMSPKFWTTFGFNPSEKKHLASEWQDLIFQEDLETAKSNMQKHLAAPFDPDSRYDQIVRYRATDGTTRYIRCTGQAIVDETGKPYRVLGLHTDLSEKIRAQQLRLDMEELRRLRGFSEFLPQLTWTCTEDGSCDYVSKRWSEYTGILQEKLIGSQWFELVHPDDQQLLSETWNHSVQTGQPLNINFRILGKNGQYRMFDTRAFALKDDTGRVKSWFGSNTDIQDSIDYQVRLEEEVARKTQELEKSLEAAKEQRKQAETLEKRAKEASTAKSRFLSSISHELRTPLNGISGLTFALQHSKDPNKSTELLGQLGKAAQHLNSLVSDVLEMSRIEEGRIQLNVGPNSLREISESALAMVSESASHKGLEIRFEFDQNLPPAVLCDDVRVKQILINFLNNAVKFTDTGFVKLACKLALEKDSGFEVVFEVEDSGIGIQDSKKDKVFELFEQAEVDVFARYGGSGLGLGLVKGLSELMGGKCGVHSELAKGSKFWVSLPLKSCAVQPSQDESSVQTIVDWSHRHILIADDVDMNLMVLDHIIKLSGAKITKAKNGLEVIACLQKYNDIDLVLMDVHMPKMDGLQATREIRKMDSLNSKVKIVALTGAAMEEDRRSAFDAGMDEVIFKPVEPAKLWFL